MFGRFGFGQGAATMTASLKARSASHCAARTWERIEENEVGMQSKRRRVLFEAATLTDCLTFGAARRRGAPAAAGE